MPQGVNALGSLKPARSYAIPHGRPKLLAFPKLKKVVEVALKTSAEEASDVSFIILEMFIVSGLHLLILSAHDIGSPACAETAEVLPAIPSNSRSTKLGIPYARSSKWCVTTACTTKRSEKRGLIVNQRLQPWERHQLLTVSFWRLG
jgi:hypothetical protein